MYEWDKLILNYMCNIFLEHVLFFGIQLLLCIDNKLDLPQDSKKDTANSSWQAVNIFDDL